MGGLRFELFCRNYGYYWTAKEEGDQALNFFLSVFRCILTASSARGAAAPMVQAPVKNHKKHGIAYLLKRRRARSGFPGARPVNLSP